VLACHEVAAAGGPLAGDRISPLRALYWDIIAAGEAAHPRAPPSGKRGRTRPSKAVNLLHRLRRYADDVRFMTDSGVPFTNTLAEQAVRMSKVTQKVSGCFRTRVGARAFCTIPSHLDTLRKQGIHPFRALTQTFQGKVPQPRFVEPPLLQAVSLPGDILSSYVFFSCTSGKSSRRSPRS